MKAPVPPWWTSADQAELDVLAFEFTRAVLLHRGRCDTCRTGGPWCPILRAAFDVVLEWRYGRRLQSEAVWLRERQTDLEALSAAVTTRPPRIAEAA